MKISWLRVNLVALTILAIVIVMNIPLHAGPSPSINRVVTPGAVGPCTWFVSLDGTTPIAEAMVGGLSVSPGDNVVGTAGQDFTTFYTTIASANQNICLSAQTFTLQSVLFPLTGDNIIGSGMGATTLTTSGNAFTGGPNQQGVITVQAVSNVKLTGFTLNLPSAVAFSGITVQGTASVVTSFNTIQNVKVTGTATGDAQIVLWINGPGPLPIYHTQILNNVLLGTKQYGTDIVIAGGAGIINDTLIQGNRVEGAQFFGFKFSQTFKTVMDTKILDNTCYNLVAGSSALQQATCVTTVGTNTYTQVDTSIAENHYYNSLTAAGNQGQIGVYLQGQNDSRIIDNTFITTPNTNSICFAPGENGVPDYNVQFVDNFCQGWGTAMDFNSVDMGTIQGNEFVNCGGNNGFSLGYNVQKHVTWLNNIFLNCSGLSAAASGAFVIGNLAPAAIDILVEGNLIVDNRTTPFINSFITTTGGGAQNSTDITIKDNKVWIPNNTTVIPFITKQNAANIPPRIVEGNTILTKVGELIPIKITNPFGTVGSITNSIGPYGTGGPVASTTYTVYGSPILVSAGGGAGLSITVTDVAGSNLFTTAQSTLQGFELFPGYKINFGGFSAGPTFIVEIPW